MKNWKIVEKKGKADWAGTVRDGELQVRAGKKGTGRILYAVTWSGNLGHGAAVQTLSEWVEANLEEGFKEGFNE